MQADVLGVGRSDVCAGGGVEGVQAEAWRCVHAEAWGVCRRRRGVCAGGGVGCVQAEAWGVCRRRRGVCAGGGVEVA